MSKKDKEEELKLHMRRLEAKYNALQVVPILSKMGTDQQGDIAAEGTCCNNRPLHFYTDLCTSTLTFALLH